MNIIIVGCGKTGSRLARNLDERGYDVAVIDEDENKFGDLGDDFSGLCVSGTVIDVGVLRNAGCDDADMAVVVTGSDNVNVMVAETLKVEFGIDDVFVRILDPSREAVFRRFGLRTICATRLEADIFFNLITNSADDIDSIRIGGSSVQFAMLKADRRDTGKDLSELIFKSGEMPFAIKRKNGQIHLANESDLVIEDDDKIIIAII